jgi:hypothetical protein
MEFEVTDWPSQYHAILGRPAYAWFMAVPHYTYLLLKMPGPNGVIMVTGSFTLSDNCDRELSKISESFGMAAEYAELKSTTDYNVLPEAGLSLQIKLSNPPRTRGKFRFTQATQRK